MGKIFGGSGNEVVDAGDFVAFGEEALTKMGADKAGCAGDQNVHSFSVDGLAS